METVWSKKRILTVYLNIAEFGDGIFGVEAASQRYFHKPASKLTMAEAALLAAVLPNPIRFKANAPSGYVRSRQAWILRQMRQLGGRGLCGIISCINRWPDKHRAIRHSTVVLPDGGVNILSGLQTLRLSPGAD